MKVRGGARELTPEEYSERVGRAIAERVRSMAVTWQRTATPAPPEDEFVRAVLTLPALAGVDTDLGEDLGPFYDTAGVMRVLGGVTKQAVQARRRNGTILALRTSDARWVYPVFQFDGAGVNAALRPAIQALRGTPRWTAGLWFLTPNDELGGMNPLEWVKAGLPAATVTASAVRAAAEWV